MTRGAPFTRALDSAPWTRAHWRLFTLISLNYALNGIMFSIAPVLAYVLAPDMALLVLSANLLAEALGAVLLGRFADAYGRKRMFMLSLALESASLILLFPLHTSPTAFLVLTSIMTFGVGGEFGAAYSLIAELAPARHRGKALVLATNFWNVGAALFAALALAITQLETSTSAQVKALLASALATALVVGLARIALPESPRWLVSRGKRQEAAKVLGDLGIPGAGELDYRLPPTSAPGLGEALSRYRFRLAVLAIVTVTQYVTYGMLAYYAPYAPGFNFGVELAPTIVLVANAGASLGGLALAAVIDKSRKNTLLAAFALGTLTALLVMLAHDMGAKGLFLALVFANLWFSEWAWGGLSSLQSELFPTGVRASIVGLLTSLTGITGAVVVYSSAFLTARGFLATAAALWALGLAAALAWKLKGRETAGVGVEELETS